MGRIGQVGSRRGETSWMQSEWSRQLLAKYVFFKKYLSIQLVVLSLCCCLNFSRVAVRKTSRCHGNESFLVAEQGLQGEWASVVVPPGSRAQGHYLWCRGLVALQHMASSLMRDRTHVPWQVNSSLSHQRRSYVCLLCRLLKYIYTQSYIINHVQVPTENGLII